MEGGEGLNLAQSIGHGEIGHEPQQVFGLQAPRGLRTADMGPDVLEGDLDAHALELRAPDAERIAKLRKLERLPENLATKKQSINSRANLRRSELNVRTHRGHIRTQDLVHFSDDVRDLSELFR